MDDDDLFGAFEDDDSSKNRRDSIKRQPEIKTETKAPSSNE